MRAEESASEEERGHSVALTELRGAIEALLFIGDAPLQLPRMAAAVGHPVAVVAEVLAAFAADLDERESGVQLREVGGGFRLYTRERYAAVIEGFLMDGQRAKLSRAALETLAVIAYRQPVMRSRISSIRGVNVDGVVRTLLARGLIHEVRSDEPGGAAQYATTAEFLERMGLSTLEELPSLAPLLPDLDTMDTDS